MILASWASLSSPLGGLLGCLGGLLDRLGLIVGVSSRGPLGPSWPPFGALWARLEALSAPSKSRDNMPGTPGGTRQGPADVRIWAPGPSEALGIAQRTWTRPLRAQRHGGG
eukprot:1030189-Pyramimonas_sp.AAC.1